jgi:hypothetical protein
MVFDQVRKLLTTRNIQNHAARRGFVKHLQTFCRMTFWGCAQVIHSPIIDNARKNSFFSRNLLTVWGKMGQSCGE